METATHRMPPLTQWEEAAGGCAKADDARGVDCHTKSGKRLECSVHKVCRLRSWVQQSGKRKYSRNRGGACQQWAAPKGSQKNAKYPGRIAACGEGKKQKLRAAAWEGGCPFCELYK